jgi:tetratricopeptide (TPR) repeat protein
MPPPPPAPPLHPRRLPDVTSWSLALLAALTIALVRPRVADDFHKLRITHDVYPFPSAEKMVVASLGYRSALADAILAHVFVAYGLHFQENRRFEFAGQYLDAVNALDPTFRDPYRFADTLVVLGPTPARLPDYLKAREILERGLRNRPYDSELWNTAGQYIAYLAPPYLPTDEMKTAWRVDGAKKLARACELAGSNENIPYHCIVAATLFERAGEREAAISSLERLIAVTDDPEIERVARAYLQKRLSSRAEEEQEARRSAFRARWKADLPFVNKDTMLVLGPAVDAAACAGTERALDTDCPSSWRDWGAALERTVP